MEKNECKVQSIECILNRNKVDEIFRDFKQNLDEYGDEDEQRPD